MKFVTDNDAKLFLAEIERIDLIQEATKDFKPDEEMMELFLKKRRSLVPQLKDFKKRQKSKKQWRYLRYKMMGGIRRFHKSTAGKKFHRALARYNATREQLETQSKDQFNITSIVDILKALSSLKTHSYIELEYYHPFCEELEYRIFFEELIPLVEKLESKLLCGDFTLEKEDEELLLRVIDTSELFKHFSELYNRGVSSIEKLYEKCKEELEQKDVTEDSDFFYVDLFSLLKNKLEFDRTRIQEVNSQLNSASI